jgi:hypothetical protein
MFTNTKETPMRRSFPVKATRSQNPPSIRPYLERFEELNAPNLIWLPGVAAPWDAIEHFYNQEIQNGVEQGRPADDGFTVSVFDTTHGRGAEDGMVRVPPPSSVASAAPGDRLANANPSGAPGTWRAPLLDGLVHDLTPPLANGDFAPLGILSAKPLPKGGESLALSPPKDAPLSTLGGSAGPSGGSSPSAGTDGTHAPNLMLVGRSAGTTPLSPPGDALPSTLGGSAGASGGPSPSTGTGGTHAANSGLARPSAGTMSQEQAASQTPQTAGHIRPLIALPSVWVDNGGYVPVNADDDNGSALTPATGGGIPAQRDFNKQPLPVADPDLKQATVSYLAGNILFVKAVSTGGDGRVQLWTDPMKTQLYIVPGLGAPTVTFYVEGTHVSSALWDVALEVTYLDDAPGSTPVTVDYPAITVTPIITSFTVTPHVAPSVVFTNGTDGIQGLDTQSNGNPGAKFNAQVTQTNTPGTGIFIQNFLGVDNGSEGGAAAGWVFTDGSSKNTLLNAGDSFPILDKNAQNTAPPPDYDVDFNTLGSDANTLKMYADDSPNTGAPVNSARLTNIDVTFHIRLYVVWEFPDTSLYTLAYDNWNVVFQADTYAAGHGVTHILAASGVSADPFVKTNADVPALKGTTFNNSEHIR